MRAFATLAAAALLAAQTGCGGGVPSWRLPQPPSDELRRGLGPVDVVLEDGPPLDVPAPSFTGGCCAAGLGGLAGMGAGALVGLKLCGEMGRGSAGGGEGAALALACIFVIGAAVTAVAIPVGGLVGAAGARPDIDPEQLDRSRTLLQDALEEEAFHAGLRSAVLDVLRRDGDVALAQDGPARTLLVVGRPLAALSGPHAADPPLLLFGQVPFRLVRAADGRVLHEFTLGFRGDAHPVSGWIDVEGTAFRRGLRAVVRPLAERAVEELFRVEVPPLEAVDGDPDPARPELRWTALPAPPRSGITGLEYDLRVSEAGPGTCVYVREGLPAAVHRVEEDLPRGRDLLWSVRARYRRDGELRLTPWLGPEGSDRDGDVTRRPGVPLSAAATSDGPGSPTPAPASPRR